MSEHPGSGTAGTAGTRSGDVLVRYESAAFAYDGKPPSLEDVTVTIRGGEALALIGPNGAGKSTLLKGILGLVPLVRGTGEVLGTAAGHRASASIGYMPQTDEIDPTFPVTLRQVVMMGRYRGLGPLRWPGRADREAVAEALERTGLSGLAGTRFGDLSGGQQQRGILARALASRPRLLLLDEPFNGLDRPGREALLSTLRELRAEGVAIIVSTHDFEIASEACSHVLMLNRCQIAAGPVEQTLTPKALELAFAHATADDEAHSHFHRGHGHFHDPGYRDPSTLRGNEENAAASRPARPGPGA